MELVTQQINFNSELSLAMAAVETKATLPVAGLVHLEAAKGSLVITSTNLDFGIRSVVPTRSLKTDGVAILDAGKLHKWLSQLSPDSDVTFKLGKSRASMKAGSSVCNLSVATNASFPDFPAVGKPIATLPGEVLHGILSKVSFVIANFEDSRFQYSGAQLLITKEGITAVATGGNRLAVVRQRGEFDVDKPFSMIIARKAVNEVSKISGKTKDSVRIYANENNLFFGFGTRLVYSRAMAGTFPNWSKALPPEDKQGVVSFSAPDAISILSRVASMSDAASKQAILEVSADGIHVTCASELGDSSDKIPGSYAGQPVKIAVNCSWLIDGLRAIDGDAELRFISPSSPVELRAAGSSDYRYVVATMEVKK